MRKEFKTALLIALAGFAWAVIEYITGFHSSRIELHSVITWFAMVPVLFIYIWHYRQIVGVPIFRQLKSRVIYLILNCQV